MSGLDLDAIQARADAATAGAWKWSGGMDSRAIVLCDHDPSMRHRVDGHSDAEFIATARTDVPALVAALKRIKEAIADAETVAAAGVVVRGPIPDGVEGVSKDEALDIYAEAITAVIAAVRGDE